MTAETVSLEALSDNLVRLAHLLRSAPSPVRRGEITPEQYWLLRLLGRAGSLRVRALADALGVTSSSVTMACKRLEKAGLLTRQRQTHDERVVEIALTPAGRVLLEEWRHRRRMVAARVLAPLTPSQLVQLQQILECLLETSEENAYDSRD